jgi:hypothetical protein
MLFSLHREVTNGIGWLNGDCFFRVALVGIFWLVFVWENRLIGTQYFRIYWQRFETFFPSSIPVNIFWFNIVNKIINLALRRGQWISKRYQPIKNLNTVEKIEFPALFEIFLQLYSPGIFGNWCSCIHLGFLKIDAVVFTWNFWKLMQLYSLRIFENWSSCIHLEFLKKKCGKFKFCRLKIVTKFHKKLRQPHPALNENSSQTKQVKKEQ